MLYLGIDFGTTGVRTGLYEKNGNEIAFSSVAYDTFSIKPSYAEQHPYDWWEALGTATKDLLKKSQVHPEDIASLAVDFHSCSSRYYSACKTGNAGVVPTERIFEGSVFHIDGAWYVGDLLCTVHSYQLCNTGHWQGECAG